MHATPSPPSPKILIAGAGIGGLITALQLHAHGFHDIEIFEASPTLTTLGVGINVQPHAVLILRDLGLLPALLSTGIQTKELNYYDRFGNAIISEPRGLDAGYTVPQLSIHRGELQMLLLDAVKERVGEDRVHLDHALKSWKQEDVADPTAVHSAAVNRTGCADGSGLSSTITAYFTRRKDADLPPAIPSMTGNMLIAADGINSTARRLLYPAEGPAKFSGRMLWRGCLETSPYLTGASMAWCGHANQKFIAYPISSASTRRGKSLVNWIAELRVRAADDPDTTPPKVDWTRSVEKDKFAGAFDSWTFGFLDIPGLVGRTERVYEFPMCDRDPVERWSFGRMTLLGDAAHPMYPIGSNGASQSIIDAAALTTCLLTNPGIANIPAALQAYQKIRLPPTAKIVMANRGNGPDQVMQVVYERAPNGFENIYDVIPKEELEGIGLAYKAVAGFEIERVNAAAKDSEGMSDRLKLKSPQKWTAS